MVSCTNGKCCRRWFITINGKECSSPAPIDAVIHANGVSVSTFIVLVHWTASVTTFPKDVVQWVFLLAIAKIGPMTRVTRTLAGILFVVLSLRKSLQCNEYRKTGAGITFNVYLTSKFLVLADILTNVKELVPGVSEKSIGV